MDKLFNRTTFLLFPRVIFSFMENKTRRNLAKARYFPPIGDKQRSKYCWSSLRHGESYPWGYRITG